MGLAEVTITMEDPDLAEAARFVFESAASEENQGPNTESTEAGSTEGIEKSDVAPSTDDRSAIPMGNVQLRAASGRGGCAVRVYQGKRRKKSADNLCWW